MLLFSALLLGLPDNDALDAFQSIGEHAKLLVNASLQVLELVLERAEHFTIFIQSGRHADELLLQFIEDLRFFGEHFLHCVGIGDGQGEQAVREDFVLIDSYVVWHVLDGDHEHVCPENYLVRERQQ